MNIDVNALARSGGTDDPGLALGIFNAWVTPICANNQSHQAMKLS